MLVTPRVRRVLVPRRWVANRDVDHGGIGCIGIEVVELRRSVNETAERVVVAEDALCE